MDFENKYIDELIEDRRIARENKDWELSDEIRNYLDIKLVFIFDTKENDGKSFQEIHYLTDNYFSQIYTYKEKNHKEWSETKMEKIERLYGLKFKSKREFVEWNIKKDIASEKRLNAWIYSLSFKPYYSDTLNKG